MSKPPTTTSPPKAQVDIRTGSMEPHVQPNHLQQSSRSAAEVLLMQLLPQLLLQTLPLPHLPQLQLPLPRAANAGAARSNGGGGHGIHQRQDAKPRCKATQSQKQNSGKTRTLSLCRSKRETALYAERTVVLSIPHPSQPWAHLHDVMSCGATAHMLCSVVSQQATVRCHARVRIMIAPFLFYMAVPISTMQTM